MRSTNPRRPHRLVTALLLLAILTALAVPQAHARRIVLQQQEMPGNPAAANTGEGSVRDVTDDDTPEQDPAPRVPVPEGTVMIRMNDGSTMAGQIQSEALVFKTVYGTLRVPATDVVALRPGLDTQPAVKANIERLLTDLGDGDEAKRNQARAALLAMGYPMLGQLRNALRNPANETAKGQLEELIANLTEQAAFNEALPPLIESEDLLTTPHFTARGRLDATELQVKTAFGVLTMKIEDVHSIAQVQQQAPTVRRSLTLDQTAIAQRAYRTTGIRVQRGDTIIIRATGSLTMTPWGGNATSGPDGQNNYGWMINNVIPSGCLIGRIGSTDTPFIIGSQRTFRAERAGTLYLAIAMHPSYARPNHQFPGQYTVRVTVRHDNPSPTFDGNSPCR